MAESLGVILRQACVHRAAPGQAGGHGGRIVGADARALGIAVAGKAVPVAVPGVQLLAGCLLVQHSFSRHIALQPWSLSTSAKCSTGFSSEA